MSVSASRAPISLKPWQVETVARWRSLYPVMGFYTDLEIWNAWLDQSGWGSAAEDEEALVAWLTDEADRMGL